MSVFSPSVAPGAAMVIAIAGFVAGVPHGAIDHLIAARLGTSRSLVMVVSGYAALAVVVWAGLRWAGAAFLLMAVALSAVHFGLGELEISRTLTGWQPVPAVASAIAVSGCGALILPIARSGEQFQTVAATLSPELGRAIGRTPVQITLAAIWLVAAIIAITVSQRAGHPTLALDVVLIGALGLLAPPLVAFAVWFGGWHALRHMARLLTVEPGCVALLAEGRPRDAALRLGRLSALPSAAALTVVAGLIWAAAAANDSAAAAAEVLRVLLALTVPHMAVVFWLDRLSARDFQLAG